VTAVFKHKLAKGVYSYLDSLERIEVRGTPLVDMENLLGIPDHPGQVAGQHNLNNRKVLITK
jgi:hypothetical protein